MTPGMLDHVVQSILVDKLAGTASGQLACIIQLVYYCGLKKDEVGQLQVKDVLDANDAIYPEDKRFGMPIESNGQTALRTYLKTKKERKPSLLPRKNPLFPGYSERKTLERHLEEKLKIQYEGEKIDTSFGEIKTSGIENMYSDLFNNMAGKTNALNMTAKHFRYKVKKIEKIVYPKPSANDPYKRIIELVDWVGQITIDNPNWKYEYSKIFAELRSMHKMASNKEKQDQIQKCILWFGKKCKQLRKSTPNPMRQPIISTLGDASFAEFIKAMADVMCEDKANDNEPWVNYYKSTSDK